MYTALYVNYGTSQVTQVVKSQPANAGDSGDEGWIPGLERSLGEGNGHLPTPVFLPGKSHAQRGLVGYGP